MSEDTIYREDAIKAIEDRRCWLTLASQRGDMGYVLWDEYYIKFEDVIDALLLIPSADRPQGEWIPCSERLPSESGRYLVVYPMLINKPWVSILWYGKPTFPEKDEPCFYASDDEYGDVEYSDVIAWMPLPEPYEEREGE